MRTLRLVSVGGAILALAAALSGCSMDSVIWGPDGARVIQTTEGLIDEMSTGKPGNLACDDAVADFGSAPDWDGLSAGEPEHFVAEYWDNQASLNPQWSINLEGLPVGLTPGSTFPGDVFYMETDEGLCVIDIAWATLVAEG